MTFCMLRYDKYQVHFGRKSDDMTKQNLQRLSTNVRI